MMVGKAAAVKQHAKMTAFGTGDAQILLAFPVLVLAYCGQFNTTYLYRALGPKRTIPQFMNIIYSALASIFVVYLGFGLAAYYQFGSKTAGNVLSSLPKSDTATNVARVFLGFNLMFTYPLVAHSLRKNVYEILVDYFDYPDTTPSNRVYITMSVVVLLGPTIAAVAIPGIDVLLGFTGSTLGVTMIYLLPSAIYLGLTRSEDEQSDGDDERTPAPTHLRTLAYALFIAGLFLGLAGLGVNFALHVLHTIKGPVKSSC